MKRLNKFFVTVLLSFFVISSYAAFTPVNLTQAKDSVNEYYQSGQHQVEVSEITQKAKDVLYHKILINNSLKNPKKLAIIFDIDDTALDTYPDMRKYNFADNDQTWDVIQKDTNLPANQGVLELYTEARALGVSVFFVTARPEMYKKTTEKALANAGYKDYQGLYLIPKKLENEPAHFKADVRRKISDEGYHIVLNMGDQYSDLEGGYASYVYKLPNYMYGAY